MARDILTQRHGEKGGPARPPHDAPSGRARSPSAISDIASTIKRVVCFNDFFVDDTRNGFKIPQSEYATDGSHIIIDQGDNEIAGYSDRDDGLYTSVPIVVFGDHTRIVKYVDRPFFLGADGVKILKPKEGVHPLYSFFALKAARIESLGYSRHFKLVKEIRFPLPPLADQKRIAAILDKICEMKRNAEARLQKLDLLVKARFNEMFGDLVVNPCQWKFAPLGEICDVRDGTHASPKYHDDGYPLMTSKNFSAGIEDFSDVKLISKADYDEINKRSKVDVGDIVMPMIGTIGHPVIIKSSRPFAIKNVSLIKFWNTDYVNVFVKAVLDSAYFQKIIEEKNRGNTQKFIALGDIRGLPIPCVPVMKQQQFAAFVEKVEGLKATAKKELKQVDLLYRAKLQEYFG